jgi:hypothetical protein
MGYLQNPVNRSEMTHYISGVFKIDSLVAEKAFASILPVYSKDGTKPQKALEREIDIYRETLQITKSFTPQDLEDMSFLKKAHDSLARQVR